ncbi:MAG: 2-(1,2-epoxy-1,2-dihydrophenyl)acetyl-CoA isomerase [Chloroflexi bacterium]|nr:2-(1,2-epoxy-1,2-dihydrophenyl)acetyl-CoA isomerase [Chloroflexi bacterium CFX1]MCK6567042.1 enoyl-CoA hydratase-related protein [Anaerolineales bacterium]MCQ3952530.1 2-(1,2-epoxy-1,2-dihydrophenyl)acetyl-CoA isomerase [Chloroflexota bacterium]MDL1918959.1 2-(1,2-epoxy-1,2-dihydrophenyl)acetyl-CoA isomerase [Chloroflexi bacterium CFX5]NUQ59810.1 enoyl-CoA hydratase/isomerase family protein [Anaerolineales bacterium]
MTTLLSATSTTLSASLEAGSLTLSLNRPERANAFNLDMTTALQTALAAAGEDSQVRCVTITGTGKTFSAGQDIGEMKKYGGEVSYREHLEKTYNPLILQIRGMGKPVVAAVNGACAGAAFGIALACDLRIAHTSSYFAVGFSGIALAPDSGVSLLLPKLIGLGRAQEYFYTNRPIPALLAHEWGLVNKVGGFNFQRMVRQVAAELARGPREAFAAGKKAFNEAILPNLAESLAREGILQEELGGSDDHREAVTAFFEKRKPGFRQ